MEISKATEDSINLRNLEKAIKDPKVMKWLEGEKFNWGNFVLSFLFIIVVGYIGAALSKAITESKLRAAEMVALEYTNWCESQGGRVVNVNYLEKSVCIDSQNKLLDDHHE